MAQVYYGANLDQNIDTIVVGTSTNSTDVEVRVNTGNVSNRTDLLVALENLKNAILIQPYPFA